MQALSSKVLLQCTITFASTWTPFATPFAKPVPRALAAIMTLVFEANIP